MSGFSSGCTNRHTNQSRTIKDRSGNAALGPVTQSQGLLFPLHVCWEWIGGVFRGWRCASGLPSIFTHDQVQTKEESLRHDWPRTTTWTPPTPQQPQLTHPSPFTCHSSPLTLSQPLFTPHPSPFTCHFSTSPFTCHSSPLICHPSLLTVQRHPLHSLPLTHVSSFTSHSWPSLPSLTPHLPPFMFHSSPYTPHPLLLTPHTLVAYLYVCLLLCSCWLLACCLFIFLRKRNLGTPCLVEAAAWRLSWWCWGLSFRSRWT